MNKYYVIRSKNMANTMSMVTGQRPYIFENGQDESKTAWSFINDNTFKEAFEIINKLIEKNRK